MLSTSVDVDLNLIDEGARVVVGAVSCDVLPWLGDAASLAAVEQQLAGDLRGRETCGLADLRALATNAVDQFLASYDVRVSSRLNVHVVEHSPSPWLRPPGDMFTWLRWTPYDRHVIENAKLATATWVDLGAADLYFHPDRDHSRLSIPAAATTHSSDFLMQSIALAIDGHEVARRETREVFTHTTRFLTLPTLPVRCYSALKRAGVVALRLYVDGSKHIEFANVPARAFEPAAKSVALFVDLGSTSTKLIELPAAEAADPREALHVALRESVAEEERTSAHEPRETEDLIRTLGLPRFVKAEMGLTDHSVVARWFADATASLAAHYATAQDRLVLSVAWSFPSIDGRSVETVSSRLGEMASDCVLVGATLLAEHASLRSRFGTVLRGLAAMAHDRKQERDVVVAKNDETEAALQGAQADYATRKRRHDKSFWRRLFLRTPRGPDPSQYATVEVPSLDDWHSRLLEIRVDSRLRDVLILDAGGYSLDVYCQISDGAPFGQSFAVGGELLTGRVRAYLEEVAKRDVPLPEAEARKLRECTSPGGGVLADLLKAWTEELYSPAIEHVVAWVAEHAKTIGLPLIATGGAMLNPHLQLLIRQRLDARDVKVVATNALELAALVGGLRDPVPEGLSRFRFITHKFAPSRNYASIFYDVAGGLFEAAAEEAAQR